MYKMAINPKHKHMLIEACEIHNTKYEYNDSVFYILSIDDDLVKAILSTFGTIFEASKTQNHENLYYR